MARQATVKATKKRTTLNLEKLEDRINPATLIWDGEAGTFNWNDAKNWSTNALPSVTDDVVIPDLSGTPEILVDASTAIRSLDSRELVKVTAGKFALGSWAARWIWASVMCACT